MTKAAARAVTHAPLQFEFLTSSLTESARDHIISAALRAQQLDAMRDASTASAMAYCSVRVSVSVRHLSPVFM